MPIPQFDDVLADDIRLVNRVLTLGGILPVSESLTALHETSDAGIVYKRLLENSAILQGRGWFFHLTEREPIAVGSVHAFPYTIIKMLPSPCRPGDPQPASRYEFNLQGQLIVHDDEYGDRDALFDVHRLIDLSKCPLPFINAVVYQTAREFHQLLGLTLPRDDEQIALAELERIECEWENTRQRNVFTDSNLVYYPQR